MMRGSIIGWLIGMQVLSASAWAQQPDRMPAFLAPPTYFTSPAKGPDFYQSVIATQDAAIEVEYINSWSNRWNFGPFVDGWNQQTRQMMTSTNCYQSGASLQNSRYQFADRILAMRVNATVQAYLISQSPVPGLKRTGHLLEQLKEMSVAVSEESDAPEMKAGYDVVFDAAKVSLANDNTELGVYQANLLRHRSFSSGLTPEFRLTRSSSDRLTTTSLTYKTVSDTVEATVGRGLQRNLYGQISTSHPVSSKTVTRSLGVSFLYSF